MTATRQCQIRYLSLKKDTVNLPSYLCCNTIRFPRSWSCFFVSYIICSVHSSLSRHVPRSTTGMSSDDIHPVISAGGGVYSRKERKTFRTQATKVSDVETASGETILDERDLRKKQVDRSSVMLQLSSTLLTTMHRSLKDGLSSGQ